MPIDVKTLEQVAEAAALRLSDKEKKTFIKRLNEILAYVGKLKDLDLVAVEPTFHISPLRNVFRDDHVRPGLPRDEALAGAPAASEGQFKVPRIL